MTLNLSKNKDKKNYLELTPYRKLEHETTEAGTINVLVPRFKSKLAKKLFQPRNKSVYIKANLDEFGSQTWLLINGTDNVHTIGEKLKEHFGDSIEPVYERLTLFLTQLYNNGFISFHEIQKDKKA